MQNELDIISQCEKLNWHAGLWNQNSSENLYFSNTTIIRYKNKTLVAQRRIHDYRKLGNFDWRNNFNDILISELDEDTMELINTKTLVIPYNLNKISFEDPRFRICPYTNDLEIWCCSWRVLEGKNVKMQQDILKIYEEEDTFVVKEIITPDFGYNLTPNAEKNWCPIEDTNLFIYSSHKNHIVFDLSNKTKHISNGIMWEYGEIRGGTPAVKYKDDYIAFMHSSVELANFKKDINYFYPLQYFLGVYKFSKNTPHKIINYSSKPILKGSFAGNITVGSPAVIFPCGVIYDQLKEYFIITFGINDCASGWVKIPAKDIDKYLDTYI